MKFINLVSIIIAKTKMTGFIYFMDYLLNLYAL